MIRMMTDDARVRRAPRADLGWRKTIAMVVAGCGFALAGTGFAAAQETDREVFTLSGQIVDSVGSNLVLRHEGGIVEVNFSGWPERVPGGPRIMGIGDRVTVTGWLDESFFRSGSLDILGVYVEDRRAFFTLGEEGDGDDTDLQPSVVPTDTLGREGSASMTGTILELLGDGFVLRVGPADVTVDTSGLFYNPYDDVGIQVLKVGDRVHVTGALGTGFPEQPVIEADGVTDIHIVGAGG
jgi:hypothetical protein